MSEVELNLAGKTKLVVKKFTDGRTVLEICKPGSDRYGHGWLIEGGAFLEPHDARELAAVLTATSEQGAMQR